MALLSLHPPPSLWRGPSPSPAALRPPPPPETAAPPSPEGPFIPTMADIVAASRRQNMRLEIQTAGPLFRVIGTSMAEGGTELGRAEGILRPWTGGLILHLDSMKMSPATLRIERSIFGLGLFIGGAAVRHGFDSGCRRAELLAINDSDLYHSKVRTELGFLFGEGLGGFSRKGADSWSDSTRGWGSGRCERWTGRLQGIWRTCWCGEEEGRGWRPPLKTSW